MLALDTATAETVVALSVAGEIACELAHGAGEDGRPRHAGALLELVAEAAAVAGGWDRITAIAVGVGPGTFTGLRIGVTTARALGQATGIGLVGVSSLEALAGGIGEHHPGRLRLALIDARRQEAFAALYDAAGTELWAPFVAGPAELAKRIGELGERPLAAGDGSLRFRDQLEAANVEVPQAADPAHRMAARHLCALAAAVKPSPPEQVTPVYLRRPDAEVWREQRDRDAGPR